MLKTNLKFVSSHFQANKKDNKKSWATFGHHVGPWPRDFWSISLILCKFFCNTAFFRTPAIPPIETLHKYGEG